MSCRDEVFADEWDAAYEDGTEAIEQEAWRRGVEGTVKPPCAMRA